MFVGINENKRQILIIKLYTNEKDFNAFGFKLFESRDDGSKAS
jgi:hypothetical protein